jgi:hypothetical protein
MIGLIRHTVFILLLAWLVFPVLAQTNTMIVPREAATGFTEGSADPFFFTERDISQVYGASLFERAGSEVIAITGVAFRKEETTRSSIDVVVPRIILTMSIFPGTVSNATGDFSGNLNRVTVFDSENVHLFAPAGTQPHTAFSLRFNFAQPFLYDRRLGQLTLNIQSHQTSGQLGSVDAQFSSTGEGRYFYYEPGLIPKSSGEVIVSEFSYVAVPEPSGVMLMAAGSLLVLRCYQE